MRTYIKEDVMYDRQLNVSKTGSNDMHPCRSIVGSIVDFLTP